MASQFETSVSLGTPLDSVGGADGSNGVMLTSVETVAEKPQEKPKSSEKKDVIVEEFWMTTTVEMDTPDFSEETTGAKLYMKWNLHNPSFFKLDKEIQAKTLLNELLVFDSGSFPSDERKLLAVEKIVEGEFMAKGCYFNSLDNGTFPINPASAIKNEVPGSQKIQNQLCWVQLHPKNDTIACQLTVTVQVYTRFNMRTFPFDQHVVPLALQIKRPWKDEGGKKHAWVLAKEKPAWAPAGWKGKDKPVDKAHVVENIANIDPESEIKHICPVMYWVSKGKVESEIPVFCLRIYRDPTNKIISVTGPICGIGLMSMGSFFLGFNNADQRLTTLSLAVLALAAYKTALTHMIPQKSYLTLADKYLFFGFAFFAVLAIKVVLVFQGLSNSGVGFFWYDGPSNGEEADGDDWDSSSPVYQHVDDATSLTALGVWVLLHGALLVDCVQRSFTPKGEVSATLLDKCVRKEWGKLYEDEVERTKYKVIFFGQ